MEGKSWKFSDKSFQKKPNQKARHTLQLKGFRSSFNLYIKKLVNLSPCQEKTFAKVARPIISIKRFIVKFFFYVILDVVAAHPNE